MIGHDWFVVLKMVDHGMPLAHTLFLPITYCAYSVIGVSVIRLITLGYFTFLFEVRHSRFLCIRWFDLCLIFIWKLFLCSFVPVSGALFEALQCFTMEEKCFGRCDGSEHFT